MKEQNKQIFELLVNLIDDPKTPMRSSMDEAELFSLGKSIKEIGLIQPIVVKQKGEHYEVVAGHRRLAASKMVGLQTIQAIIKLVDDKEDAVIKVHENLFRSDVNIVDEAFFIRDSINQLKVSPEELAKMINRSTTYVLSRLKIIHYDNLIIEMLKQNKINLASASWLAKIKNEGVRRDYLSHAVRSGITSGVARQWYELYKLGTLPPEPSEVSIENENKENEKKVVLVNCEICKSDMPLEEAGLFYAHKTCIEELRHLAVDNSDKH